MTYRCPKCQEENCLKVVRATVYGEMPLAEDGFMVTGSTEDEIVMCGECNHEGPMTEFIFDEEDKESLVQEAILVQQGMWKRGGGFVKRIADALGVADLDNMRRIKKIWPEYWTKYLDIGKELRKPEFVTVQNVLDNPDKFMICQDCGALNHSNRGSCHNCEQGAFLEIDEKVLQEIRERDGDEPCKFVEAGYDSVWEMCPICNEEVRLEPRLVVQTCPNCKNDILPCSMCEPDEVDCSKCPLEKEKKLPIKNQIKDRYYKDYEFVDAIDALDIPRIKKMDVLDLCEKYFLN